MYTNKPVYLGTQLYTSISKNTTILVYPCTQINQYIQVHNLVSISRFDHFNESTCRLLMSILINEYEEEILKPIKTALIKKEFLQHLDLFSL